MVRLLLILMLSPVLVIGQNIEKISPEAKFWIADSAYLIPSQAKAGFEREYGLSGFEKKNDTTYITHFRMWPYTDHHTWESYVLNNYQSGERTVWGRLVVEGSIELPDNPDSVTTEIDTTWITSSINSLSGKLYFEGDWVKSQQPDRTIAFSNKEGNSITAYLELDSTSVITIVGEYLNTHGKVRISVNGEDTVIDTYSDQKQIPAQIYEVVLQPGKHIIQMTVEEEGKYFVLVGIDLDKIKSNNPTPDPDPNDTTLIISSHNELHKALESALGVSITRKGSYEVQISLPDSTITIKQPDLQIQK